jgi:hypothetical protein
LERPSDNPAPWLVFEPACEPSVHPTGQPAAVLTTAVADDCAEQPHLTEVVSPAWFDETSIQIIHATRAWIQYGTVGFAVICIVIGAVEALFGR